LFQALLLVLRNKLAYPQDMTALEDETSEDAYEGRLIHLLLASAGL